ncbi:MAG: hypothetical protein E4G93_05625, partial [Dehalococcoidia bacterium]
MIAYNDPYGANQTGLAGKIIAIYNYWRDPSGPYHSAGNPDGLGDTVSDRVLYDPWLTTVPAGPPSTDLLVLTYGPKAASPGETVNLGFLVPNVTSETV